MKSVFVIDPGMMEAGGHHAALLETLIHSKSDDTLVSVLTHKQLDNDLENKAKKSGIQVHRIFSTNFYQHYEDSLNLHLGGMQHYIRLLAWEYTCALKLAAEFDSENEVVCFYPCLNWEHASAISLALTMNSDQHKFTHKVCCMFKPLEIDQQSKFLYKYAFGQLAKHSKVKLFASDWETRGYYYQLGVTIEGIHPCYLLPWQQLDVIQTKTNSVPHLLLYMGDAKENKGFLLLPSLVKLLLANYNVLLTVQYTLAWDCPKLADAITQLDELATEYKQLQLVTQFWSMTEVVRCMNETDLILCTYDTQVYQNKSSGLAWLASYFNVPVILRSECWLRREFERLGLPCLINSSLTLKELPQAAQGDRYYRESLYADLLTWLTE